jgi:hypothetical protein
MHAWERIAFAAFKAAGWLIFRSFATVLRRRARTTSWVVAMFEHRAGHRLERFGRRARTPALARALRTIRLRFSWRRDSIRPKSLDFFNGKAKPTCYGPAGSTVVDHFAVFTRQYHLSVKPRPWC